MSELHLIGIFPAKEIEKSREMKTEIIGTLNWVAKQIIIIDTTTTSGRMMKKKECQWANAHNHN